MMTFMQRSLLIYAAAAAAGTVTYILGVRQTEKAMDDVLHREIEQMRQHYKKLYKVDEYEAVENLLDEIAVPEPDDNVISDKALAEVARVIESQGYHREVAPPGVAVSEPVRKNIFEDGDKVFPEGEKEEVEAGPYVIDTATFMEDDEYEKATLTYWEGDRTVSDEREEVVPEYDMLIGIENLDKFGESDPGDPDVVYIRNERMSTDFEVLRHSSKYAEQVAGYMEDDQPTHEPIRRPRPRLRD